MTTTNVFSRNLAAYTSAIQGKGPSLICNQGGKGSSKTMSIAQLLYVIALKVPLRITVASYALPHLKAGVMHDLDMIISQTGGNPRELKNKTESKYYINGSEIECIGITGNEARATGPRRDILYINEANKRVNYNVFDMMNGRTHKCTFIDWNPSSPFWFNSDIQGHIEHVHIKSTYLDNPYLPKRELDDLLMKKDNPKFENWWRVYGLGELGQLEGAIYTDWEYGEFDYSLPVAYGLDFGSTDPDAMVKVAIDKKLKRIYMHEELFQNHLKTRQLADIIKNRVNRNDIIVADSASPRTITDLQDYGINVRPAKKGSGSIVEGIKVLQDYTIIITEDSTNLADELNYYIWNDKRAQVPMDDHNHLLDAARYITTFLTKKVSIRSAGVI